MSAVAYAAELKKTYRCYGHFYRLHVEGAGPQLCRSVLEITSLPREAVGAGADSGDLFSGADKPLPPSEDHRHDSLEGRRPRRPRTAGPLSLQTGNMAARDACTLEGMGTHQSPSRPDAAVIMMNPGSSRPLEEGDTDRLLRMPLPAGFQKPLVLTRPDNTQYQIMRIMAAMNWTHVRVLNLSDLRDPKSPSFIARTQKLAALPGGGAHSLFCLERAEERARMLDRKPGAPILLGWGRDEGLIPLARRCLDCLAGAKTVAVPAGNDPALTAHPSPMLQSKKEAWLRAILAAL